MEPTDEMVIDYLRAALSDDEQAIYISDKKIATSIKEYLYHLFNEMGGVECLKRYKVIIFAGSCELPPEKITMHLVKPEPNEMNVLIGV